MAMVERMLLDPQHSCVKCGREGWSRRGHKETMCVCQTYCESRTTLLTSPSLRSTPIDGAVNPQLPHGTDGKTDKLPQVPVDTAGQPA